MHEDPHLAQSLPKGDSFTRYLDVSINGNQYLIVHKTFTKNVYIIFRGTDEQIDIKRDLHFSLSNLVLPYKGEINPESEVRVHSGFLDHYMQAREVILSILWELYKKDSSLKFIFGGHSLGGTGAILASLDFQHMLENELPAPNIFCITAGAPRVGNKKFAESHKKRVPKTYHLVNGWDPVFHQFWPILGYDRSGEIIKIGNRFLSKLPLVNGVRNHYIQNYLENLPNEL